MVIDLDVPCNNCGIKSSNYVFQKLSIKELQHRNEALESRIKKLRDILTDIKVNGKGSALRDSKGKFIDYGVFRAREALKADDEMEGG